MTKLIIFLTLFFSYSVHAQEVIPSEDLRSDAGLLWQALNELHPGTYRHTDTIELQIAYKKLLDQFSTDRSPQETFKYFSEFIVKLKCGHTYLNPYNQPNKIINSIISDEVLLPFTFKIIQGQMVVEKSFDKHIFGNDLIKCINDIKVASILDSLSHYIKADGNRKNKKLKDLEVSLENKFNYFDYYFPLIFENKDSVSLELEDGTIRTVALMSKKQRGEYHSGKRNSYDDLWSYTFAEDHAYLELGSFVTYKMSIDWEDYLNNFFDELKRRNITSLIIDIRNNEGGMTEVSDHIVNLLAKEEGQTVPRRQHLAYKKVSDNIRPHVSTWSKWFYNNGLWTKKLNKRYRTPRFIRPIMRIKKNRNAYKGDTYLLINEGNSSATFQLAENCKVNGYATLIGTETGGTKMGINGGQIFFLKLPKTKIEIDIPLIGYYSEIQLPDEGILPDKVVMTELKDYRNNIDGQLNYTMELIRNKDSNQ